MNSTADLTVFEEEQYPLLLPGVKPRIVQHLAWSLYPLKLFRLERFVRREEK
jgi:hypothetical protein